MACKNKEKYFGGRRVKSVTLVSGEHQISPASGENSRKISASGFVSEKNFGEPDAMLSRLAAILVIKYVG